MLPPIKFSAGFSWINIPLVFLPRALNKDELSLEAFNYNLKEEDITTERIDVLTVVCMCGGRHEM